MEQQDNTFLENYLQNSQNLMENLQIPSGIGCVDGNIVASDEISGIGANIGGKFEENEHSEGEWKYVQEVQQSEKQQTIKVDGKEGIGNGVGDGMLLGQHEYEVSNGNRNGNGNMHADIDADVGVDGSIDVNLSDASVLNRAALLDEEEVEIIKNDGDFSTTSNTTSTAGEDVDASDLLHVDIKIDETQHIMQQQNELLENIETQFGAQVSGRGEETEEEEPSSLATNTTNGTSSLSENSPQQLGQDVIKDEMQQHQDVDFDVAYDDGAFQHKSNPDSLKLDTFAPTPTDFNMPTMHSPLNPDAKEFVPRFGSNPASPTPVDEAFSAGGIIDDDVVADDVVVDDVVADEAADVLCSPHPVAIPRHLIVDDFVAASPIKGSGSNMDYVMLPGENEFDHEAAQRPHELEQEDDLIGDGTLQEVMPLESLKNGGKNLFGDNVSTEDCLDYQQRSPDSFIDHGPETCVDLDNDVDTKEQSIHRPYEDESIENILNTVQPLPNEFESHDTSFTYEINDDIADELEILNTSQPTHEADEIEMNLRNKHISENNEIPQQSIDMDNAALMQESVYLEHTSTDNQFEQERENADLFAQDSMNYETTNQVFDDKQTNILFDNAGVVEPESIAPVDTAVVAPLQDLQIPAEPLEAHIGMDDTTPSPISTEEKHLLEDTKEQYNLLTDNVVSDTDEIALSDNMQFDNDGDLTQLDQVAQHAAPINNDIIDLTLESEDNLDESKHEEELYQQQQQELLQNEPITFDENQQHNENLLQSMEYEHEHQHEHIEKPQTFENILSTDLKAEFNPFAAATEFISNAATETSQLVSSLLENVTATNVEEIQEIEKEPILELITETHVEPLAEPFIETAEEPIVETAEEPILETAEEPILETAEEPIVEAEVTALADEIMKAVTPEPAGLQEQIFDTTPFAPEPQIDNVTLADTTSLLANLEISSPEQIADTVVLSAETPIAHTLVLPTETPIAQEPVAEDIIPDTSIDKTVIAAVAGAAVVASATAAVVATNKKASISAKKPIGTTTKTTTITKTKSVDNKKPAKVKKPTTTTGAKTTTLAASRPRTTPAKPTTATTGADKKPTPAVAPKTTVTMTKRTVTSANTAPKPATKTTTARPTSTPAARTTTSRPIAATTTNRKVNSATATLTTTNIAKPRQSLGSSTAAIKPTTLGLNTAVPKQKLSPRVNLTSQSRNTATATAAAKSPIKPATNNGLVGKTTAFSVGTNRSKPTTTTTTSTTRTFTARPAPKTTTTITTTTTTTRRTTTGSAPNTNTTKTTSTVLRKSTPLKNLSSTPGKVTSPSKSSPLKPKTKDANKAAASPTPKPIALKSKKAVSDTKTNDDDTTALVIQLNGDVSSKLENGTHEPASNGTLSEAFNVEPKQHAAGEIELISSDA